MTGQQLIDLINHYDLTEAKIIPNDIFNDTDGEYLKFSITDKENHPDVDYKVLWLTNDYIQDVVYNKAGSLTYGICDKTEKDYYEYKRIRG